MEDTQETSIPAALPRTEVTRMPRNEAFRQAWKESYKDIKDGVDERGSLIRQAYIEDMDSDPLNFGDVGISIHQARESAQEFRDKGNDADVSKMIASLDALHRQAGRSEYKIVIETDENTTEEQRQQLTREKVLSDVDASVDFAVDNIFLTPYLQQRAFLRMNQDALLGNIPKDMDVGIPRQFARERGYKIGRESRRLETVEDRLIGNLRTKRLEVSDRIVDLRESEHYYQDITMEFTEEKKQEMVEKKSDELENRFQGKDAENYKNLAGEDKSRIVEEIVDVEERINTEYENLREAVKSTKPELIAEKNSQIRQLQLERKGVYGRLQVSLARQEAIGTFTNMNEGRRALSERLREGGLGGQGVDLRSVAQAGRDAVGRLVGAGIEGIRTEADQRLGVFIDSEDQAVDDIERALDTVDNTFIEPVRGVAIRVGGVINGVIDSVRNKFQQVRQQAERDIVDVRRTSIDRAQEVNAELQRKIDILNANLTTLGERVAVDVSKVVGAGTHTEEDRQRIEKRVLEIDKKRQDLHQKAEERFDETMGNANYGFFTNAWKSRIVEIQKTGEATVQPEEETSRANAIQEAPQAPEQGTETETETPETEVATEEEESIKVGGFLKAHPNMVDYEIVRATINNVDFYYFLWQDQDKYIRNEIVDEKGNQVDEPLNYGKALETKGSSEIWDSYRYNFVESLKKEGANNVKGGLFVNVDDEDNLYFSEEKKNDILSKKNEYDKEGEKVLEEKEVVPPWEVVEGARFYMFISSQGKDAKGEEGKKHLLYYIKGNKLFRVDANKDGKPLEDSQPFKLDNDVKDFQEARDLIEEELKRYREKDNKIIDYIPLYREKSGKEETVTTPQGPTPVEVVSEGGEDLSDEEIEIQKGIDEAKKDVREKLNEYAGKKDNANRYVVIDSQGEWEDKMRKYNEYLETKGPTDDEQFAKLGKDMAEVYEKVKTSIDPELKFALLTQYQDLLNKRLSTYRGQKGN